MAKIKIQECLTKLLMPLGFQNFFNMSGFYLIFCLNERKFLIFSKIYLLQTKKKGFLKEKSPFPIVDSRKLLRRSLKIQIFHGIVENERPRFRLERISFVLDRDHVNISDFQIVKPEKAERT